MMKYKYMGNNTHSSILLLFTLKLTLQIQYTKRRFSDAVSYLYDIEHVSSVNDFTEAL